jgi:hypothetical protein
MRNRLRNGGVNVGGQNRCIREAASGAGIACQNSRMPLWFRAIGSVAQLVEQGIHKTFVQIEARVFQGFSALFTSLSSKLSTNSWRDGVQLNTHKRPSFRAIKSTHQINNSAGLECSRLCQSHMKEGSLCQHVKRSVAVQLETRNNQ